MKANILYKVHENEDCSIFLYTVRYIFAKYKIDIRPTNIIERNMPANITKLPTISVNSKLIEGIDNIIKYYESLLKINNLKEKAIKFNHDNPEYRMTLQDNHFKNVIVD